MKEEHCDESNIPIISCHGEERTQFSVPEKKPISMVGESALLLLPTHNPFNSLH